MMFENLVLVFSALGVLSVSAQILQNGQCDPNVVLQTNFDPAQFAGTWYEVSRTGAASEGGDCSTWEVTSQNNAHSFTYNVVDRNFVSSTTAQATLGTTAQFTFDTGDDFWILGTNYAEYAVGYRCENVGTTQRNLYIWLLGRSTTINPLFANILNNLVADFGITTDDLRSVDHSDDACFTLPTYGPNEAVILFGQCDPNISLLTNFDATRFVGTWNEVYSYYSESAPGTCSRAQYSVGANGGVDVVNSQVVDQSLYTVTGVAVVADAAAAQLSVTLEVLPGVFSTQDLWVIDTDYDNYAISYSCTDLGNNTKRVFSWIASRERSLSAASLQAVNTAVDSILDLNFNYYQPGDQSAEACFYYPPFSADNAVEFPGECDLTIPAVPNFDAVRYMGLWHDIASYPTSFQEGTCSNAYYTLNEVVDVYNTQVINQTLDTINGTAVPVSTDGSAKLEVTFPIAGTNLSIQTPYWVLATDYDTYSLVYTCTYNAATDTRTVFSWKLGRNKFLSDAANQAINNVIATIPVLDDRYYITKDQTPEGCFYFPEPQPGVPVNFPGQCDESIAAVPNFDLNQFQGTWYEIETYPKEESGQCVRHEYTQGTGNNLNLISSFLLDNFPGSSFSVLEFTSTDQSGKFSITVNTGTTVEVIPFWILSVDYNDYALAYSCMNRGEDYRAVYSWKLSRNREQLSIAAQTQITNVINTIDVLDESYFETIEQDEIECIPLPEIPEGEPIILEGQCNPNIPVVQNFEPGRYVGLWHLIETYPSEFQNGDCNDATYTAQADGSVLVFNTQVVNQTLDTITGLATVASTDGSAKLLVTFPDAPFPVEYWVIDTDYDSYALVYSCVNLTPNTQQIWSWKMSRTKSLTAQAVENIETSISSIRVLNNQYYYTVDNTDEACFYYPEPNGNPVIFRGQCNESIPVVTNFNAVAYMGLWYDIESYPQLFQEGSCATANYNLVDGGVDVFNTQVINQTLDTILGRAYLVETADTQAKLDVYFPIEGVGDVFSPYWVLDTDYTDYALVYACQNLGPDSRSVSSWKLSRTRTLSTQAQQNINTVIAGIDVLQQQYFEVKGHTDEQCFYYPVPTGEPVVFRGACDDTIQAMPNFDLERFAGQWNEIQTYPKDQAGGQCINHEFSINALSDTTLQLTSNQVFNSETLLSNDGQIVLSSTDGSGRFTLTITTASGVITMPYWVIDTDYTDYALVYSCMARNENSTIDSRAVYSWKLSRSRDLSAAANEAINNVTESIDVLQQQYYENVSQTDEACFYLPELSSNEPVIFPGRCNPNISVVQNFSPGDYVGLWHLVETYYSEFQNGDCNDATYTAQADGSVLVFNTQVVNQTLDTITGQAVLASNDGSAKLLVTFPDAPFPIEYWVIDTDYTSYSLVYSCVNLPDNRQQVWSWKMSRTKSLTAQAVQNIENSIASVPVLNNRYFNLVDNSDEACFYFPEPNGNPVIFRGQCNESIPVVTNFNAVAYMGLWYDIESYPQLFQEGSCATANYNLVDGSVDVFNTQVVNQTLDTILGRAFLVETPDTQAKLDVYFPIEGLGDVFSPYWVLDTDYTDYALVYACQNLGPDSRSVSSWKLSRTRTLSTQAQQNINTVIAGIDVLQQQYYEVKGHTDEQCFYYPEPTGEPVVFRGACDDTIQAMPNFDLERFAGQWNEIQTYPKDQAGGQCINHEFSINALSNTTLQMTSNQVFNSETLVSNDGQIVLSSTDGSGRFTLTITTASGVITMPYWVIDTDYTDYALVYSCMARNEEPTIDSRAVYSWKLSRSRDLSAAANEAINNVTESIDVLQQQYYENVSQTDEACFYLPELSSNEPVIFPGRCNPNISVVQNFSPGDYVGLWHLVETYYSEFQNGDCNDATYTAQADGSVLVFNTQVVNQTLDTITGQAVLASNDGSAKLLVTFPDAPFPIEYWVIDTDYTSYSLVYSCVNLPDNRQQVWSWKMSRTKSLTAQAVQNIENSIASVPVLNNRYFNLVDNSDEACFYFPEPNGNPVIFRGQCNESIPVVTNFNAVAYMGLWYDIESYPQLFQEGSCATANYNLVDGSVDVFNTQVVNQTLDTILGRAFLVETPDTQAKLDVYFPIEGLGDVFSPYWVLDTDYTDYALVYACQNLGPDSRSVSSWKLSRTRTLSTQAQQNINTVIAGIDVLQQQYYEVKGHTDEQCFYYPEPTGEPVVFRGACDDTIQAMPNFDLERFAGQWNEIQTYPKDQAGGQCINHEFSINALSNTTLQMTSNQVFNSETLVSNDGQIVLSSTDGSGRFTLTITTASGVITMPYWVIDTDYTDYALVYSCMARNEEPTIDSRAVYSWKLSRSRDLSAAANEAINNVTESIDVLQQQYYENVSQTDEACFYLPELSSNEPVIFPGRCNPNISVVQNFSPGDYVGLWHLVETYYSEFQNGDCNDATYTAQADGSVLVFNTQVVNQTLDTITGQAVLASNDGSAKLLVTFPDAPFPVEYWVIDTDYTSYSLVYSCVNLTDNRQQVWSWKMSRTKSLTTQAVQNIENSIASVPVLNNRYFNLVDNSDDACFYFPEPDGNPVTFRGRCDESIPVVQNFNVEAYLGQWYDIQSYPQTFQDGECATALYTLGANGVDVFNTQVVNQQLDTIDGLAVLASNDGSAKLDVSFVVDGFQLTTPYWVLATDYTNYSLVYSCSEINDEYRRVSAWKLSRTRTLDQPAEEVINEIISDIPVLDQRYFREIGHSEDDCFYYPDNNGGPVILNGQCPNAAEVPAVTNFNANLFGGTWHELSRFPSELQDGECASTDINVQSATQVAITNNIVNNESLFAVNTTGSLSSDGRGVISFGELDYYILDTDYNEFALLYACQNRGNETKQIYSWVLSRSRDGVSQASTDRINAIVSDNEDLFDFYYETTEQTNDACFHYPEFDELPAFIELPGPCSTHNIVGMPNFDAAAYLGRWFEIARYPQPDQIGMCAQATYSLGDNVVDVYNTQVVNRTLLIQEGDAVVASTDGSGVLLVTFDVNGIIFTANYVIVASDYTNYALVYSCRDLDNGNSQVFSWKLSRERTLSNAASQAINNAIASNRGLREDYYMATGQTDEDCFYVPEPNPEQYVAFRGQCGDITGMQNFDAQSYVGLWHEVERYPTGGDDGECISSNFQPSGNTIQVTDTSVFGNSANINTQTVTVSADGRITRGNTDMWVLDTDYESYAVVLSCENIDNEYRRVWSAKHSRTRTLSEAAQTAISEVLERNDLLHQQFYLQVDQSDDACFYYPEATGQPVMLPGHCDDNIPVMTNFELVEYTGTWYQIERYPQFHESGNCTGARYTLDEDEGVVTVLNWEVIDGELDTIEGTATPLYDDGTARFGVVLPSREEGAVEGDEVETSLYVLTTDYTTYALAYSCVNVDAYHRQIGVWKLSRTRDMPASGTTAINTYMAQRQELDQRYFLSVSQSEDCEEPSSSYLVKSSIILLLICSILHKLL